MHPLEADGFEWDEANEEYLFQHRIAPWEAEEVFLNDPVCVPDTGNRPRRWKLIGRTAAGRALTIVVQVKADEGLLRAFTGWPCTAGEQTRYLTKRKGRS